MSSADEVTPRAEVLREAETLITGDRNKSYGTPTQNFNNIADLWNTQFAHLFKDGEKFEARHVAEALILLKLARNIADPKRDNWVDLAGYAACGYETTLPPEEPETPKSGTWITWPGGSIVGTSGGAGYTVNNTFVNSPSTPPNDVKIDVSMPSSSTPQEVAKRMQEELNLRHRIGDSERFR